MESPAFEPLVCSGSDGCRRGDSRCRPLFVAAVIIFPTFQPGDLIAGLGITSVAIGFAFKGRPAEFLCRHLDSLAAAVRGWRSDQDERIRGHG